MQQWVASLVAIVLAIGAGVVGPISNWPLPVWLFFVFALSVYALASSPILRTHGPAPADAVPASPDGRPTAFVNGSASGSDFTRNDVRADYFVDGDAEDARFEDNSFNVGTSYNESIIQRLRRRWRQGRGGTS